MLALKELTLDNLKDNAQLLNLQAINNLVLQYRFGEIQPFGFLNGCI